MEILGYDVQLGLSVSRYAPEDIRDMVANGIRHFEVGIPAVLPEHAQHPKEEYESFLCRGREEMLVALRQPMAEAIRAENLGVWSVHLPFGYQWDVAHYDEGERDMVCESLKRVIALTKGWGAKLYVLHGCLEPVALEQRSVRIARGIRSLRELDEYASRFGARVVLENLPRSCLANTAAETRAMSQAAGNVPICFDVNHLLEDDHDLFLSQLADRVVTTHLSDYDKVNERHWLPGLGVVPWKRILLGLMEVGYKGPFLFELSAGPNGLYRAGEIVSAFRQAVEK